MQTVPLALRRVAPLGVLVVISAAVAVHSALGYEIVEPGTFGSLVALYGAASLTDNRRGVIAAAISATAVAAFFSTNRGHWSSPNVAGTSATWAAAWLAGTFVRFRREQAEAAGARAASLECEHDTRAREAVADERARMARELHDIVGHALNVVVIQAAGARRVLDTRPDVVRDALASIESTGREALFEMERMLGVLPAAEGNDGASGPQPGLAQLDSLAAHISDAGIPVDIVVEGDRSEIPASVDLSAYRIVQESLTNCLKHSGASHATVTLRYRPEDLEVEIVDNGPGSSARSKGSGRGGRGHIGMRERVALFGGEISIGPKSSAGCYSVRARLPFKGNFAMSIRVLLVDDEQLVRSGFRLILEAERDIEVVGEAANGIEAVEATSKLDPDVVLMDVQMPIKNGLVATVEIAALGRTNSSRVLILTTFDLDEYVYEALRAGASGFLLKRAPAEDLVAGIRIVAAGDALLAPSVTRRLIDHFASRPSPRTEDVSLLNALTEREREIFELVAQGLSNSEIADRLFLTEGTVKTHVSHVFEKLDVRDRTQAVIFAYDVGVVKPRAN